MDPGTGTAVVILAGAVVVVGIGAYLTFKHYCRLTVSASAIHVALYGTTSVTATLDRKSWAFGTWTAVVPATYAATPSGNAGATVTGSPTAAPLTSATVTITGAANGTGTIKISASGGDCTGLTADLSVTVP